MLGVASCVRGNTDIGDFAGDMGGTAGGEGGVHIGRTWDGEEELCKVCQICHTAMSREARIMGVVIYFLVY
jgi:hypothetical protein